MYPEELKYYKEHEWVRSDGDVATIGISHYAQNALGDVVYLELPEAGEGVAAGETFGEIESVKSVSQLFSPVSGQVVEVNSDLEKTPEVVNNDPYGAAWMIKVKMSDPGELDALMSPDDYKAFVEG